MIIKDFKSVSIIPTPLPILKTKDPPPIQPQAHCKQLVYSLLSLAFILSSSLIPNYDIKYKMLYAPLDEISQEPYIIGLFEKSHSALKPLIHLRAF